MTLETNASPQRADGGGDIVRATILDQRTCARWTAIHGDCVEAMSDIPDNSIDISVYSPPFSSLYIYSESARDMGNVADDDAFFEAYSHVLREKLRITRPGRLSAVHVKDLVYYQGSSARGDAGLRAFSDMVTTAHVEAGWTFHCRITIWRDPVIERGKTNAHGLLRKTRRADSTFCRVGMPEYLMIYRKWATAETDAHVRAVSSPDYPTELWQQEASPVWEGPTIWNYAPGQSGKGDLDLAATNVLNVKQVRDDAEKHLCPMPLNITRRALELWSSPGDVVLSPFMGIGSEGFEALRLGRRFVGIELKREYFETACRNLAEAEAAATGGLFDAPASAAAAMEAVA
jgi:hypothetical protein